MSYVSLTEGDFEENDFWSAGFWSLFRDLSEFHRLDTILELPHCKWKEQLEKGCWPPQIHTLHGSWVFSWVFSHCAGSWGCLHCDSFPNWPTVSSKNVPWSSSSVPTQVSSARSTRPRLLPGRTTYDESTQNSGCYKWLSEKQNEEVRELSQMCSRLSTHFAFVSKKTCDTLNASSNFLESVNILLICPN